MSKKAVRNMNEQQEQASQPMTFEEAMQSRKTYRIIRYYENRWRSRQIATGLTLAKAQAHCSDPETSSATCTKPTGRARTRKLGHWFDGYEEIK